MLYKQYIKIQEAATRKSAPIRKVVKPNRKSVIFFEFITLTLSLLMQESSPVEGSAVFVAIFARIILLFG